MPIIGKRGVAIVNTGAGKPSGRIEQLDGWRAIAAGSVVAGHFFGNAHSRFTDSAPALFDFLNFAGHLGLQALFVISGYIICHLLLIEEQRYGSFSFRGFYVRRFVRVLPPFYLYLATLAVLGHFALIKVTGQQIANAALFIVDFHACSVGWFTLHAWSLSVEEQFYLIFPTALWLTPKHWRGRVFAAVCIVLVTAAIVLAFNSHFYLLRDGSMAGFVGISWGVLFGLKEDRLRSFARRVSPKAVVLLAVLLLLLSIVCMQGRSKVAYEALALSPAIGLFLFFTVEQKSRFSSFLCWPPLRLIGITSYSLYLWQELFTGTLYDYEGAGRYILYLLPLLLLIIPVSWVVIEKPSMALGKTLSRRWRAARASEDGRAVYKRPAAATSIPLRWTAVAGSLGTDAPVAAAPLDGIEPSRPLVPEVRTSRPGSADMR